MSFLLVFGLWFINIGEINAEVVTTKDGYASCTYGGKIFNSVGSTGITESYDLKLTVVVYKDQNTGHLKSWATADCGYNKVCNFFANNYNNVFHNADKKLSSFNKNNKWQCPSSFYAYVNNGDILVSPSKPENDTANLYKTLSLKDKEISQNASSTIDSVKVESKTENTTGETDSSSGDSSSDEIIGNINEWGDKTNDKKYTLEADDTCLLISNKTREFLHDIFSYISIAGILILVVMTSISLVKVITASEDDALKNFIKSLWKRIICLIVLLILPLLITFIIQVVNGAGNIWGINSDNPLCNITE